MQCGISRVRQWFCTAVGRRESSLALICMTGRLPLGHEINHPNLLQNPARGAGPIYAAVELATRPTGVVRVPAAQHAVDQQCQSMTLYQFTTCPFCIKVRQEMRRLSLPVERRDAQHNLKNRDDLQSGGGAFKVPCLKVTNASGQSQWIYESGAIIAYLRSRFESL